MIAIEDFKDLKYEKEENGICTITINRPERRNAVSALSFLELQSALDYAEQDKEIKVIILTGNQEGNAFSSGAYFGPKMMSDLTPEIRKMMDPTDKSQRNTAMKLFNFPKPIVAAVNGLAIGVGATLLLIGADLIYASENAYFGFYFVNNAVINELASTFLLSYNIGIQRAKEILYFGGKIEAQDAHELGLVNKVLPLNELVPYAREQALKLITPKAPGLAIKVIKKNVHDVLQDQIYKSLEVENEGYATVTKSRNISISMKARQKKIEPVFKD